MNKKLHRIIFNAARGCRMVVADTAQRCRKAASGSTAVAALQWLATAGLAVVGALAAAGLLGIMGNPANAQIIADPNAPGNQRPVIINTASALPQVNIQTPSAAGVSRNTYSQFDVQAKGAILNNSAGNVQTQLGGWIAGNPMVAGGAARVILNEVNSANPSLLKGYVEVAGSKAEVIIANPAGIQVNGGGFINASTVTLTTGTPVMNAGSLQNWQVSGGKVQIEGLGLDTRTASATQILARAAEINAGLWANHLKLVLGANQVNAADPTGQTPTPITPNPAESKPRFALEMAVAETACSCGYGRDDTRAQNPSSLCARGSASNRYLALLFIALKAMNSGASIAAEGVPLQAVSYPVVQELQKAGIDFDSLSQAQKEALFSAAVQHGAGTVSKTKGADNVLERAISVAQTGVEPPTYKTYTWQDLIYGQVEDQMRATEEAKAKLITQREGLITQQLQLERQKNQLLEQGLGGDAAQIQRIQGQASALDARISNINTQVNGITDKVNGVTQRLGEQDQYIRQAEQYLKEQAKEAMANPEQFIRDFYKARTEMYPAEAKRYQLEMDSLLKQLKQEQQSNGGR